RQRVSVRDRRVRRAAGARRRGRLRRALANALGRAEPGLGRGARRPPGLVGYGPPPDDGRPRRPVGDAPGGCPRVDVADPGRRWTSWPVPAAPACGPAAVDALPRRITATASTTTSRTATTVA